MASVKIDKGIPIPRSKGGIGNEAKWPWNEMDIGDSFLVPNIRTARFTGQAGAAATRYGRKFSCRQEKTGVRVWRLA